jgi:cytoskeletal protein CcmA (bactofilin family)
MWNKQTTTDEPSHTQPSNFEADNVRLATPALVSSARIGASLTIKGSVSGEEDLQIDGKVDGPVAIRGRLTVGVGGELTAGVKARELAVFGKVSGNVDARDRVDIKRDGAVIGDIQTARISIEDGAIFKGCIEIGRPVANQAKTEASASRGIGAA